ncbi:MAG: nitroreductase family protein [Clostridia bacterium]|nr:nitroreductase family protein [Clostridia bacterium]
MLRELLEKNRSIRSFDRSVKPSESELLDMIECTRLCPSSANLQALKFKPVTNEEECRAVFSATKWAGYLKDMEIPPRGHEPTAYIIVANDKEIAKNTVPFYKDTGIVSHTILLRAAEMGYGGCMIGSFDEKAVKETLGLSDTLEITLVLALGKADESSKITENKGDIKYFRENGVHYVPKRSLKEILI